MFLEGGLSGEGVGDCRGGVGDVGGVGGVGGVGDCRGDASAG